MSHDFPTDEMTLRMLIAACEINPDTGRTHLGDFLDMGTRRQSQELVGGSEDPEDGDAPVYMVEYEEGYAPFSAQHVIRTLAQEILDMREALWPLTRGEMTGA